MGREREAGAEILERLDRLEALGRVAGERGLGRRDQVGEGAVVRAADPAAQLVQLREPEAVGAVDDHRVRGRHVDAALDDGRAHQQVEAPVVEIEHQPLEVALAHLAVADAHVGLRHQRAQLGGALLDRLDRVVDEVHLAAAADLAQDRLADRRRVPLQHEGLHREPLGRRGRDQRQVAQAAERHVEGARDGRGGQRQHVDVGPQRLQALLVAHAEAVLLVDDHEPEALEAHAGLQQPVGRDDDVDRAAAEALEHGLRLLAGAGRGAVALRHRQGNPGGARGTGKEGKVDIVIATHRLLQRARALQGPRAAPSSMRSTASAQGQGASQAAARQRPYSLPHRHSHPAHPQPAMGALRELSLITDRLRRPTAGDPDHPHRVAAPDAARGGAAGACAAAARSIYVHNRVAHIYKARGKARAWSGGAVRVVHGQMRERDLEQPMGEFYHQSSTCWRPRPSSSGARKPAANTS